MTEAPLIRLYDVATDVQIGTLTEDQLEFLIGRLEEESRHDQDYYINRDTLDMFEQAGSDQALIAMLRGALGERADMDVRWERG